VGFYADIIDAGKNAFIGYAKSIVESSSASSGERQRVTEEVEKQLLSLKRNERRKMIVSLKKEIKEKRDKTFRTLESIKEHLDHVMGFIERNPEYAAKFGLKELDGLQSDILTQEDMHLAVKLCAISSLLAQSKIVKMDPAQVTLFDSMSSVEGQDFSKEFRLPFQRVWINLEKPVPLFGDQRLVHGLLLFEFDCGINDKWTILNANDVQVDAPPLAIGIQAVAIYKGDPAENMAFEAKGVTLLITKAGDLITSKNILNITDTEDQIRMAYKDRLATTTVHLINFFNTPGILLDQKDHDLAIQKARTKKGKEPLPGWYEIKWKQKRVKPKEHPPEDGPHVPAFKHSFRYDVRGHWMRFTRGRMTGRVIWCPPHQRGLQNALYKPKVYRLSDTPATPESMWEG